MHALLAPEQIQAGVRRLAREIQASYEGQPFTIVGVLTGCVMLLADLIRQFELPLRVGVVYARSYRGAATRPGELVIHDELLPELRDHHVLLVDDIFDTGRTLSTLVRQFQTRGARSVRSAVLLRKLGREEVAYRPDFIGFEIPDVFVVGYGMDYLDLYRNLPYVATLEAAEQAQAATQSRGSQPVSPAAATADRPLGAPLL